MCLPNRLFIDFRKEMMLNTNSVQLFCTCTTVYNMDITKLMLNIKICGV